MPGSVTVPSTLKGHAAEIWRGAFLSAYDDTCKDRKDRDACAAKIAWGAVKAKYRKGEGDQWVEKAADPVAGPLSTYPAAGPEAAAGAPSLTPGGEPMLNEGYGPGADAWKSVYRKALEGECRNAKDPEACARAVANKAVSDRKGPAEGKAMTDDLFDRYMDYPLEYVERREFSTDKRERMAKTGSALPGGRYPIENCSDVANAVKAFGRAKPGTEGRVKAHILSRARSLGCMDNVPEEWKDSADSRKSELFAGYSARTLLRYQANQSDLALLSSNDEADRPEHILAHIWRSLPADQRTVRAEALRRITERNYAQSTEDLILEDWDCLSNPHAPEEFVFQRYLILDASDRPALVRAILVRKSGGTEWYLKPLTAFAGSSLSVALEEGEVRHQNSIR